MTPLPTNPAFERQNLSPALRHRILVEWNQTRRDYPLDKLLHQLFEEQVQRTPDAVAIEFEQQTLTYNELNQHANQLAHELIADGVGPDVLVGIYAVRSLEMVIGLLGILKASGAYVPIDPEYPPDRVAYMLADAGISVLLTQRNLQDRIPAHSAIIRLLDSDRPTNLDQNHDNPPHRVNSLNLAYLIYTSGSTGRPKGAMNTHRGIVNRLLWMQEQYSLIPADLVLQKTPFSFDVSVWEFFWPLLNGARLIVARPGGHRDASYLVSLIQARGVTVLHFVPSMLSLFLDAAGVEECSSLRHIICSGEALTADLRDRLFSRLRVQLHNLYGPTEAAVDVTHWTCRPDDRERFVPIGRPVANTQCYILNESLEPVPIGVPGELYLGGVQVGRGYHRQPELTAQKFLPDPFHADGAARLYKTGDLCRYLPDGNIQYLGRLDNQVKIRGFRIELDEIEAVLGNHPGVLRCVVTTREQTDSEKSLVAYLVPSDRSPLSTGSLRAWLANQLPDYMIPSQFLTVPAFPLTPNGKVDRQKLNQVEVTELDLGTVFRSPETDLEKTLTQIWESILGRAPIGLDDHFLDLGGHSLRAAAICAQVGIQLHLALPLRWILEFPTIAELSKRMELHEGELSATSLIPMADRRSPLQASFGQHSLWILRHLLPDSATYNQPFVWHFSARVDSQRIQEALRTIVGRHEVLRTALVSVDNRLVQHVLKAADVPLPWNESTLEDDVTLAPTSLRAARMVAETRQPFDLTCAPLWRVCLFDIANDEQMLVFTFHHSIIDEWSIRLLIQELETLYVREAEADAVPLPELTIQYADFAHWQRTKLTVERREQQLDYWKRQLANLPSPLDLRPDRPRPAVLSGRGAIHEFQLPGSVTPGLRRLARDESTTLFAILLAGFQVCLYRHSGQTDLIVGTPYADRAQPNVQSLIGYFLNTLPIRVEVEPASSFRHHLRRLNKILWEGFSHSDLPFEQMVELAVHERPTGHHPVFQVLFVLLEEAIGPLQLGDVKGAPVFSHTGTSKVDLTLDIQASGDNWVCRLEYATDLFDPAWLERFASHFQTLISGIVENPDTEIDRLPLLAETERRQLLVEWNQSVTVELNDLCVHQMFEQQVDRTPDAVAVTFQGTELTYRDLNNRANQLAQKLRRHGVSPDVLVGLLAERSLEQLIGLLAVLKAGGAYVPLDPAYPTERLRVILEDAQVRVLLTQKHLVHQLPPCATAVLDLNDEITHSQHPTTNLPSSAQPSSLAYVLYTSGSTGKPKGVAMEHRPLVNLISWQNRLGPAWRTLQFASVGFDVSFQEIFSTWCSGGTLVLIDEFTRRDMSLLLRSLSSEKIERLFVPFVVLQQLTEMGNLVDSREFSLREVITAGEQLFVTPAVVSFFSKLPDCTLINQYGPTESHVVTSYVLSGDPAQWPAVPPIGRPISNARIYLLDARLQPVPAEVPGELCIGGIGLARGYRNLPELSADRFLIDPFHDDDQARIYRTGDKACWRADGQLKFLGRIDHQVKFRGYRIELGEIESVLNRCQQLSHSVVILREDHPGDKRIVAYLVPEDVSSPPSIQELRRFLESQLPEYMLPSSFIVLDSLPLTVNGKVDRKSLPAPVCDHVLSEREYIAPRTPVEKTLENAWKSVLATNRIGIHDNFFELGGHSLMATRLVSRVRSELEFDLSIRTIFEYPTIAGMAEAIETSRRSTSENPLDLPPGPVPRHGRLPMSFAQERLWFLDQYEGNRPNYNLPWGWRLTGTLNPAALEKSLQELIRRHEPLRTTFRSTGQDQWQEIHAGVDFDLTQIDLRQAPENQRPLQAQQLFNATVMQSFDLSRDLMLRATLIQLEDHEFWLVLTMHHIAFDGWSLGVLEHELAMLYRSFVAEEPSTLPALDVQYADYAVWQRQRLQGGILQQQWNYWKQQLAGIPGLLEIPTDYPRPPVQGFRGARRDFLLNKPFTQSLYDLSRQENVTPFMTLLAGWQLLLARYSGQTDIVVGVPIAGRNRSELERLIGLFVNTLALRTNLSERPTVRQLLQRVREITLQAYSNQDLPFEKLVQELNPARSLNHSPIFQVMFVLHTSQGPNLQLPDLSIHPLEIEVASAKFDLVLSLTETPDELRGTLEYDADLFTAETMGRLIDHYKMLLQGFVATPETAVDRLPLLTDPERRQILVEWNQTATDDPDHKSVPQLFEAQSTLTPQAIAVEFQDRSLTYAELNQHANRLAQELKRRGVGSETRVGICVHRSPEMLIALLAILKAGGCYVPLDPHYPNERLSFLIADTGLSLILTQSPLRHRLQGFPADVLLIDEQDPAWSGQSTENLPDCVSLDQSACIIYTSGSTGVPKGVEVLHRGIVRLVRGADYVQLDSTQAILQLAVLSFDASTFEIWGPLLNGARCVLAPQQLPTAHELQQLIQQKRIRTLWLTSTLFNAIVDDHVAALEGLEQLLVGGEALSVPHIRRAQQALGPQTQIINGYGPTECTTFACCFRIPREISADCQSIPIGRPISKTTAYVLDDIGEPVPIGIIGELWLGGAGVARGYLNRPELTDERFVTSRWGERLYRTGDLVRWRSDGTIEFRGRRDQQVKLRGFRIELGEIESLLLRHPGVRQTVVMVREDRPGNQRLVAYVIPSSSSGKSLISDLRSALSDQLPDYMIPAAFVELPELPRNANGKVDKQGLPAPDWNPTPTEQKLDAPRTLVEETLIQALEKVLQVPQIGIHDNFFDLGGHSLMAIRAVDQINQSLQRNLKVIDLFSHPTVANLARHLEESAPAGDTSLNRIYLEPLHSGHLGTHLVIVGATVRAAADDFPQGMPIWWLKLDGLHVLPHRDLDIPSQAAAYVKELTDAIPQGTLLLCGHSYGGLLAIEIAHQLKDARQYQVQLVLLEPSPAWCKSESFMKRLARSARALRKPNRIGRIQHFIKACSDKITHRVLKPFATRQHKQVTHVESNENFRRMVPYFLQNIRLYQFPQPFSNEIHLIGTPDYLKTCVKELRSTLSGTITVHPVQEHFSHLDIAKPENSHLWVEIVNSLIAENKPAHSRAASV